MGNRPRHRAGRSVRPATGRVSGVLLTLTLVAPLLLASGTASLASAGTCRGVFVGPGQRIQRIIDNHAKGTTFCLRRGTYVLTRPLRPKSGQRFVGVGRRTAVLTGRGVSGSFAFDGSGITGVVVKRLVVRRFAPPRIGGFGAIKAGRGWRVINNEIGPNRNTGVYHEARAVIAGNRIHGNTMAGIVGWMAHRSRISGNEISYNGRSLLAGHATGGKWAGAIGIVIRQNRFHHNWSNSLWLDGNNLDVVVEDNEVVENGKGIQYEVSCAAVIRGNLVARNRGPGIIVAASRNVRVARNRVIRNNDGIHIVHQDRTGDDGSGVNCDWVTGRVSVIGNRVTMTRGTTGLWTWQVAPDDPIFVDGRVRFERNHYRIGQALIRPFLWSGGSRSWSQWRSYGQDQEGTFRRL